MKSIKRQHGFLSALIPFAPLIGAGLSFLGGERRNSAAASQAAAANELQLQMSNTAHQREVEDLRAAGLNPILSANKGASTAAAVQAPMQDTLTPAVSSALDYRRTQADIEVKKAQAELIRRQANAIGPASSVGGTIAPILDKGGKAVSQAVEDLGSAVREMAEHATSSAKPSPLEVVAPLIWRALPEMAQTHERYKPSKQPRQGWSMKDLYEWMKREISSGSSAKDHMEHNLTVDEWAAQFKNKKK